MRSSSCQSFNIGGSKRKRYQRKEENHSYRDRDQALRETLSPLHKQHENDEEAC